MIRILLVLAMLLLTFVLNGCPNSDGGDGAVVDNTAGDTTSDTDTAEEGY